MSFESAPVTSEHSASTEPVDVAAISTPHSLARAVYERRAEYVRPHRIRVKIGTWNVAGFPGTDKDLASWFIEGKGLDESLTTLDLAHTEAVDHDDDSATERHEIHLVGGNKIGLYVLGLQEVVDLNLAKEAVSRMYGDVTPIDKWTAALEAAMPAGYQKIACEQMSGLLTLIYASPEVASTISNVDSVPVGTGLLGYMGNKGAVSTRIVLGETTSVVFINSHLASGHEPAYLERRCWDVNQVLTRTQFPPINRAGVLDDEGEKLGEEDFTFWFGDLNFRLDGLPGEDIRRILMLHSRGEYDIEKSKSTGALGGEGLVVVESADEAGGEVTDISTDPSPNTSFTTRPVSLPEPDDFVPDPHNDPASLQATLDSLLPHDQLKRMIKQKKVFHDGWHEGPITFLPSYKYDVGTVGLFDSSEKQRAPSWCDRVLYRTRKHKEEFEKKMREAEEARKKDEEMKARGLEEAADDDDVLFSYDPESDGQQTTSSIEFDYDEYDEADDYEVEEVVTKEGYVDHIHLDIYTSHQRITSSDHKPIISIFSLDYDAVVPSLKAKVHAEVARELDRAENEGRPDITIVIDHPFSSSVGAKSTASTRGPDTVDFGEVEFLQRKTCSLTIANTGRVAATFSFVEKPSTDDSQSPDSSQPWLATSFLAADTENVASGTVVLGHEVSLEPGETVAVALEVCINDLSLVRALNYGHSALEDVLVLRVTDGRDYFVPVYGTWQPTCFGRSIDELIRIPDGGIRTFLRDKAIHSGAIPYDTPVRCAAPKELFKLTQALETLTERALADEVMLEAFQVPKDIPSWPFDPSTWKLTDPSLRGPQRQSLIHALDTDTPLLESLPLETPAVEKVEILAELLLLFLQSLTDGILPPQIWTKLEPSPYLKSPPKDIDEARTTILDILSITPNHNIAFVFLTATLAKIAAELSPAPDASRPGTATSSTSNNVFVGSIGRRGLFRRMSGAEKALGARRARERRFAEIFAAVLRGGEKEREEKVLCLVEIFIRRDDL